MFELLQDLEVDPQSCIVRGTPHKVGPTERRKAVFDDKPQPWVMLDLDDSTIDELGLGPEATPEEIASAAVRLLPGDFQYCDFVYQFSSSMGIKPNAVKLHLWFWLEEPRTSAEIKAYFAEYKAPVCMSVFDSIQIHYTAAPTLDDGVPDPWPDRLGFVSMRYATAIMPRVEPPEPVKLEEFFGDEINFRATMDENEIKLGPPTKTPDGGTRWNVLGECPLGHHGDRAADNSDITFYVGPKTGGLGFHCMHDTCLNRAAGYPNQFDALARSETFIVVRNTPTPAEIWGGDPPPAKIETASDIPPIPENLCFPGGLIDRVVRHIRDTSRHDHHELALAASLALISAIAGDKVCDAKGNFAAVYTVSLAPAGAGKGEAMGIVKKVARDVDESSSLVARFSSAAALLKHVAGRRRTVAIIDEFGSKLQEGSKSDSHGHGLITAFLELWAQDEPMSLAYASEKRIDIAGACLGIHGATTAEPFFSALSSGLGSNGLLSRLMVFAGNLEPEAIDRAEALAYLDAGSISIPPGITTAALELATIERGHNDEPTIAAWDDEARMMLADSIADNSAYIKRRPELAELLCRTDQKAMRLAVFAALSRHAVGAELVIDGDCMDWGIRLALATDRRYAAMCAAHMAANPFERIQKDLTQHLKKAGRCSVRDLKRRFRGLRNREIEEGLERLQETGVVDVAKDGKRVVFELKEV